MCTSVSEQKHQATWFFPGFTSGHIGWDDRFYLNINRIDGMLPNGVYNSDTVIYFCCRSDAPSSRKIILPNRWPFYLVKKGAHCQSVMGMSVREEFQFLDSTWCGTCSKSWQMGGNHPKNDYDGEDNKLYYCYYQLLEPREYRAEVNFRETY